MVSRTELAAFLKVVNATVKQIDDDHYIALIDTSFDDDPAEVRVQLYENRNGIDTIAIDMSESYRADFSITAPALEWSTNQTVDDHNLLTELVAETLKNDIHSVVSVYGPPARQQFQTIELEEANEEEHILEQVREQNPTLAELAES